MSGLLLLIFLAVLSFLSRLLRPFGRKSRVSCRSPSDSPTHSSLLPPLRRPHSVLTRRIDLFLCSQTRALSRTTTPCSYCIFTFTSRSRVLCLTSSVTTSPDYFWWHIDLRKKKRFARSQIGGQFYWLLPGQQLLFQLDSFFPQWYSFTLDDPTGPVGDVRW